MRVDRLSNEATLKYFLFGAVALAVMAYGLTLLYGLAGSLNLNDIGQALRSADRLWAGLAVGIVLIGYAFEATLVPFHFWAPDVYQGATAPVAGFLSVVPKIAGFAGLLRFLLLALPGELLNWPLGVAILAVLTTVLGNLVALRQTHMKRLLAYSSIAQAGYVLAALAVADRIEGAISAAGYYLAAYLFMNLGAFVVVAQVERTTGSDLIAELRGFARPAPLPAAVLALSLLSLAGIPPLAGFVGKVLVLQAILDGGLVWLAVIIIANMVIGLYYYIAVVAEMYLKEPYREQNFPGKSGYSLSALISLSGTLFLGILPALALQLTGLLSRLVYPR
jgi:NADH-quinone oxidoreductase subunit N